MLKLGNTTIGNVFLGSTEIGKIYLGSRLIFQKNGGGVQPTPTPSHTYVYTVSGFTGDVAVYNGDYYDTGTTYEGQPVYQNDAGYQLWYTSSMWNGYAISESSTKGQYIDGGTYKTAYHDGTGGTTVEGTYTGFSIGPGTVAAYSGGTTTPTITLSQNSVSVNGTVNTAIASVDLSNYVTVSPSGTTLTYSASNLPTGLSLSSAGVLSGTPTATSSASVQVTISATGAQSVTLTLNFAIVDEEPTPSTYVYTVTYNGTSYNLYQHSSNINGKPAYTDGISKTLAYDGGLYWNGYAFYNGVPSGNSMSTSPDQMLDYTYESDLASAVANVGTYTCSNGNAVITLYNSTPTSNYGSLLIPIYTEYDQQDGERVTLYSGVESDSIVWFFAASDNDINNQYVTDRSNGRLCGQLPPGTYTVYTEFGFDTYHDVVFTKSENGTTMDSSVVEGTGSNGKSFTFTISANDTWYMKITDKSSGGTGSNVVLSNFNTIYSPNGQIDFNGEWTYVSDTKYTKTISGTNYRITKYQPAQSKFGISYIWMVETDTDSPTSYFGLNSNDITDTTVNWFNYYSLGDDSDAVVTIVGSSNYPSPVYVSGSSNTTANGEYIWNPATKFYAHSEGSSSWYMLFDSDNGSRWAITTNTDDIGARGTLAATASGNAKALPLTNWTNNVAISLTPQ